MTCSACLLGLHLAVEHSRGGWVIHSSCSQKPQPFGSGFRLCDGACRDHPEAAGDPRLSCAQSAFRRFALANQALLWIDPLDYQAYLASARPSNTGTSSVPGSDLVGDGTGNAVRLSRTDGQRGGDSGGEGAVVL